MVESRSKKISVMFFLFAIFIMLAVFTGTWIYKMYTEQTMISQAKTLETIDCGRYYYSVKPESIIYENGTLYFEIENTLGGDIHSIIIKSAVEEKEVDLGTLTQGTVMPVSANISVDSWILVYPKGCANSNFRNISFEPR